MSKAKKKTTRKRKRSKTTRAPAVRATTPPALRALSAQHRAFVVAYTGLHGATGRWNATAAAREAGYKDGKNLGFMAYEVLHRPDVQAAVNEILEERRKQWETLLHRVIEELCAIGFSKATDVVELKGDHILLRDDLPEPVQRAIAEVVESYHGTPTDGITSLRIKMHDKVKALALLAKITGGIVERHGGPKGNDPIPVALGLTQEGKNRLLSELGMPVEVAAGG